MHLQEQGQLAQAQLAQAITSSYHKYLLEKNDFFLCFIRRIINKFLLN